MKLALVRKACYDLGHCIDSNDNFTGDVSNIYELERTRRIKSALEYALIFRGYEPYMLHSEKDGWYYGDLFLGATIGDAFLHIMEVW